MGPPDTFLPGKPVAPGHSRGGHITAPCTPAITSTWGPGPWSRLCGLQRSQTPYPIRGAARCPHLWGQCSKPPPHPQVPGGSVPQAHSLEAWAECVSIHPLTLSPRDDPASIDNAGGHPVAGTACREGGKEETPGILAALWWRVSQPGLPPPSWAPHTVPRVWALTARPAPPTAV